MLFNWFQDAASNGIINIILLHDHVIFFIITIFTIVFSILFAFLSNKFTCRYYLRNHLLENIWTITPAFILLRIAYPRLRLLYVLDEIVSPSITIKAIGHQWYWSYEYSDFKKINFDSYIIKDKDLLPGQLRLLEVDNRVILPYNTSIRVLVSSADVIHSWAVPALGVKADAIPGRLNQIPLTINRPGVFYGQCSEICGANHAFIPIAIEAISPTDFLTWINRI